MSTATAIAPQAVSANTNKNASAAGGGGGGGGTATTTTKKSATSLLMGEYTSLDKRMSVSKNVVDELLLVCGVIGTETENNEIVPVTDCLNWLQDLQRALRRDEDLYRPISILLGDWKVVQQKLLPLVLSCRYDTPMVLTVCKILVILTKPLSENTVRAGRMVIDTKKHPEDVVKEQIKLRENALKQAETLMEYKRAICHHPSHINTNSKKSKNGQGGILSIFVSLLAEPLSKTGTARSDVDHLTIELVLHLFRNLLQAEPLLLPSSESVYKAKQLHNELISLLERELVLEILLVLGADLESRENQPYNLLVMELLHHLLRHQDPTAVARSQLPSSSATNKASWGSALSSSSHRSAAAPSRLKQQLAREKQAIHQVANSTGRHSHFGGKLVVSRDGGAKKQLISAAKAGDKRRDVPAGAERRRNKKMEPFIGNSKGSSAAMEDGNTAAGPAQLRAWKTLDNFCIRFVTDCYGPVMKSLKNEFRRDSVRLEENDRAVFFRIVWFFCQWYRVSGKKRLAAEVAKKKAETAATTEEGDDSGPSSSSPSSSSSLGQLIFTMDIFSFKLVHDAIDHFQQHKKYPRLAQSVALLSEMMHLLHVMCTSKESTEQVMALGLMDRLFYNQDPVDCLPKLLSTWQPGTSTREYLCDLVELCHMTLKLLEANAKACEEENVTPASRDKKSRKKGQKGDDGEVDAKKFDTIAKMKAASADFDVTVYLSRKIISNHTVSMYTQLLSQYPSNAPHTNHRIMALFLRLAKIKIAEPDDSDPNLPKNLLATKTVTLEPMLYNIQLLIVLDKILNDKAIRNDKNFASLLTFASTIIHNFAMATKSNPMLFVEALFRHPLPHRFCEFTSNLYVTEELRMIAERELLLEEQKLLDESAEAQDGDDNNEEDDDEEDELEFEDFGITSAPAPTRMKKLGKKNKKKKTTKKKKRKAAVEESDDSDDDSKDDDSDDEEEEGVGGDVPPKKKDDNDTKSDESSDDENDDDLFSSGKKPSSASDENKKGDDKVNLKRALEENDDQDDDDDDSDIDDDDLFGPSKSSTGDDTNKKARLSTDTDEAGDDNESTKSN